MTNSSWTQNHVSKLWGKARTKRGKKHDISVVFPPCAVEELESKIQVDEASEKHRTRDLLYIAQFRPEKMHHLIIDAFHAFLKSYKHLANMEPKPRLILVGSVRDDQDEKRVYKLRLQAQAIKDSVQFVVNAKWPQILEFLKTSSVGVNGMWNEHFGIGVVEYQAAGLISVVNDSGGPKVDIVVPVDGKPTGAYSSPLSPLVSFDHGTDIVQVSMHQTKKSSLPVLRRRSSYHRRTLSLCVYVLAKARRDFPRRCLRRSGCIIWTPSLSLQVAVSRWRSDGLFRFVG